ncbi:MAG: serine/threonine-protein kinase [Planctomycetota bacterium]
MIGRATGCSLRIDQPGVSRKHAFVRRRDGADWIGDLGSSNGTWLVSDATTPRRIVDEMTLQVGDRIRIGSCELIYCHDEVGEELGEGRWQDTRVIGSGGMGEILRAFDSDLGCLVAVKKIRSRAEDRTEILQRLHLREATIGRGIDHPNVVRVLDDGMVEGSPVQVLEWVEGGDLIGSLRSLQQDRVRCLEVVRQVALGLAAAHENGVVHADLKPGNILQVSRTANNERKSQILSEEDDEIVINPEAEKEAKITFLDRVKAALESPPFVARSGELALIEDALEQTQRCWIPIFGERGVGRHRLAAQAKQIHGDRIHIGEEFVIPPEDFKGVWLTPMTREWPEESEWVEVRARAEAEMILREIHLGPLLPGPAGRLVEKLLEARGGEGALFLSHLSQEEGADGHPVRLLQSIEKSLERGAWRLHEGSACLHPLRMKESAREELKRLSSILESTSAVLRQLLERIALFEGALTANEIANLLEQDRAIFHRLVEEALQLGLLRKSTDGALFLTSASLNAALSKRGSEKERQVLIRGAAEILESRRETSDQPLELLRRGRLLRSAGRFQGALQSLLLSAMAARSGYSRALFLEALDEARVLIKEAAAAGERKAIDAAERMILGSEPKGLVAIERLRKLPVEVMVKIADFGIARRAGEKNIPEGIAWGTPRYMSPEQARREALTPSSDVFSLGLLMRELVEGVHPLGHLRGIEAIRKLAGAGLEPVQDKTIPSSWRRLMSRMLDSRVSERPNAAEIAQEISSLQVHL